jgi:hypothetical protein
LAPVLKFLLSRLFWSFHYALYIYIWSNANRPLADMIIMKNPCENTKKPLDINFKNFAFRGIGSLNCAYTFEMEKNLFISDQFGDG